MGFTHLHVHTEYSLLDGASRINVLIDRAVELGMTSLAITDHGVMYGVIDFYKKAKEKGIHPVLGCEVYVAPRRLSDKEVQDKDAAHLILLAETQQGYENLVKLSSIAFIDGFYYRPRIDYELLAEYSEGLIGLSACLGGDIPQLLLQNRYDEALSLAKRLSAIFGEDHFYIELQDHGIEEQKRVLPLLVRVARDAKVPLVATNDTHYVRREDAFAQEVLMCIQTGKTIDDPQHMRLGAEEFYLKAPEEMARTFAAWPEAIENTEKIARRCEVEFDFNTIHLPRFDVPAGKTAPQYLRELCEEGLAARFGAPSEEAVARLDYELGVIEQMGYVDYFLIVWDFIRYAKEQGIAVGPGRGSAAGSLASYVLRITDVDPIRHRLLFERFLNPERVSMPDIDIDFCYERRQEVIDYVVHKYGADRVAQIITFGTMAARAVIRDVGRALNMPYAEVDRIAKLVPMALHMTLDKALQVSGELKALSESDESVARLLRNARTLEGLPRHASTHAAGVVISHLPLMEHVPLQRNDEAITTQFPMGTLEELGLLKMDFLGLRTLTVIQDTLRMLARRGVTVDFERMEMDDEAVYKLLSLGDTDGVFQLESDGMRSFLKELQPQTFEDIVAGISLYRPGPMESIPRYIAGKRNPEKMRYAHPLLEKTLAVTYGCMVYQEQVMQIVRDLAGYSLGRSDLVRRAMAKKKKSVMDKERDIFIRGLEEDGQVVVPGCLRNGITATVAEQVFHEMSAFAEYAFNKSHAAAYGVVAYQTAYLKAHYPEEFMAALLNSVMDFSDKVTEYIASCRKHGIALLPPSVNRSQAGFSVEGGALRFGLGAIRNVGMGAVAHIEQARREKGAFASLSDFCVKAGPDALNKRMLESLIMAGAFDELGARRAQLLAVYERTLDAAAAEAKRTVSGQMTLFGEEGPLSSGAGADDVLPDIPEKPKDWLLSMEKQMTGVYITGHPLEAYIQTLSRFSFSASSLRKLADETALEEALQHDGQTVRMGGILVSVRSKTTKSGVQMAFVQVEDLTGVYEGIVFPKAYERIGKALLKDSIVALDGRLSIREEEEPKLIVEAVTPLDKAGGEERLYVKLDNASSFEQVQRVLLRYGGAVPVFAHMSDTGRTYRAERQYAVDASEALLGELRAMLGESNVKKVFR